MADVTPSETVGVTTTATAKVPTLAPTSVAAKTLGSVPAPNQRAISELSAAFIPNSRAVLAQFPNANLYRIGARFDPDQHIIVGLETVQVTNTENTALDELYFRLFANAPEYNEGGIEVSDVRVDDKPAESRLELNDTALKVALPAPLPVGNKIGVSLHFTTTVPTSGGGYGTFNEQNGTFALHNWHPELSVYENGAWQNHPVSALGDPQNTDASNYLVTVIAPQAFEIIASGTELARSTVGADLAHEFASPLTRNFVLTASNHLKRATQQVGETKVNSYYLASDEAGGQTALKDASKALEIFSQRFGAYPYSEFDVAEVALGGGAAGVEATGLILINSEMYSPDVGNSLDEIGSLFGSTSSLDLLGFIVAHETAHEWWYSTVGNDSFTQPWLDESLANWSAAFYIDQSADKQTGLMARDLFIRLPYELVLNQGDRKLDQSVDAFDETDYEAIVYGKGALMYDALRQQLGDEKFFEFLSRYARENQFKRADRSIWRKTLAEVAGQNAADAFYQKWVQGDQIRESDLPPGGEFSRLLDQQGLIDLLAPLLRHSPK
jgi:hypothetical protein